MSAIKLAPYYDTVALLGTNMSETKVEEIAGFGNGRYSQIFLCLDNDATFKAIKYTLQWRQALPKLKVRGLAKDIKDMTDVELDEFMMSLI